MSEKREIKLVEQEDDHGCVVACLAMVTGRTYADVRKDFYNDFSQQGTSADVYSTYLQEQGFSVVHKALCGMAHRKELKDFMLKPFAPVHIVRIQQFTDAEHGHVFVMTGDGKMICPQKTEESTLKDAYAVTDVLGIYK